MSRRVVDPVAAVRRQLAAAAVEARRCRADDVRARAAPTDAPISEIPDDLWPRIASLVAQRAGGCDVLEALLASEQRFRRLRNSWVFWREACTRSFPAPPHPKVFPNAEATPAGAAERLAYWRRRFDAWCRGKALVNGNGPNGIRRAVGLLTNGGATVPADHFAGPIEQWYTEDVTNMNALFLDEDGFDRNLNGWDFSNVTFMQRFVSGCDTFNHGGAPLTWNTFRVTDMMAALYGCDRLNVPLRMDTRAVTNMIGMLSGCEQFNNGGVPLALNTSAVTTMSRMFAQSFHFNQPVAFDTSSVTDMSFMFFNCTRFNQTVQFNTARVTNMMYLFRRCNAFNNGDGQPLLLDTSSVTEMSSMFFQCESFNCPVPLNTSSATNMSGMFAGCTNFNQTCAFATQNVTRMDSMFDHCLGFNNGGQPLTMDTSSVTTMDAMFDRCMRFDQTINFATQNVTSMRRMFNECIRFNNGGVPLAFDTSSVVRMDMMLYEATNFNQPLPWDVRNVQSFVKMFEFARSFAQPLDAWQVSPQAETEGMFRGTRLEAQNLLPAWYQP